MASFTSKDSTDILEYHRFVLRSLWLKRRQPIILDCGCGFLEPETPQHKTVVFKNVSRILTREAGHIRPPLSVDATDVVVVEQGVIVCAGRPSTCLAAVSTAKSTLVDLAGGAISPSLISFGSPLGMEHIDSEPSTSDGSIFDPMAREIPAIIGGSGALIGAVDGLEYGSRDAL